MTNKLFYGDNLAVMREHIADESVDLVYLDPPFNSNATYNVLFKAPDGHGSQAQIEAFDDTWHWSETAEDAYWRVLKGANTDAAKVLEAMRGFLGENDMMAYLAMMAIRLIELHRVLKPTGSLYLHCDPTASHYLKILLDAVFGARNFRSEIIWKRKAGRGETNKSAIRFGVSHDTLLFSSKAKDAIFHRQTRPNNPDYIASKFTHDDGDGRLYRLDNLTSPSPRQNLTYEYKGYTPPANGWAVSRERMKEMDAEGRVHFPKKKIQRLQRKRYLDELEGETVDTLWDDIPPLNSQAQERLGYPTQKPVALLERIISASSNEGDVVLDPFCGCGTTVHAAQKLDRRWIGIDVTHLAVSLIERRLRDAFGAEAEFATYGIPKSVDAARDLATRDKHEFEKWAITLIPDARPFRGGRKGADTGIDGIVYLRTGKNRTDKAIIEVKGGGVSVDQIHKLKSVVEREKALTGIFITLKEPTRTMIAEAAAAGFVEVDMGAGTQRYPVIQILTVEDMLERYRTPRLPIIDAGGFRKAPRERRAGQESMDL